MTSGMRVRVFFVIGLVALVGGGVLLYSLRGETSSGRSAGPRDAKAVPVSVVTAAQQPVPVELSTVGRVQTAASVAVRARIDGVITKVAVADGQEVSAGDLLFILDDREIQAALKQAQANLARDQAQLANAKRQVDRLAPLAAKNYTTRQDFDTANTNVATYQATVAADQAAIDAAKVNLSYTVMTAPIAGRIGTVALKLGNSVRAADSQPLVTINQLRPILVAFSIPQRDVPELQRAMAAGPVKVSVASPKAEAAHQEGTVSYVENEIDPTSNTLSVKAEFPNGTEALWPGQFVNVTATLRIDNAALVIPIAAVQTGQQGSYAWVIKPDDTAEAHDITVARQHGDIAVIASGLNPGDRVVTNGQLRLEPGSKVEITAAEQDTTAAPVGLPSTGTIDP